MGPDTVFVVDELADSIHVVRNGAVTRVVAAPVQPGGMASAPDGSVMVTVGVRGRRRRPPPQRHVSVSSRTTYATVRQPNTVAVDDTGELIITGSTSQGSLQFIPPVEPS